MGISNDTEILAAIRILRDINADITPHTVWVILDLQGIADDISYKDIEPYIKRL